MPNSNIARVIVHSTTNVLKGMSLGEATYFAAEKVFPMDLEEGFTEVMRRLVQVTHPTVNPQELPSAELACMLEDWVRTRGTNDFVDLLAEVFKKERESMH